MNISNDAQSLLKTLIFSARKTKDNYTSHVAVSNRSMRKIWAEELQDVGFITDVSYHGQIFIRCKVTDKGMAYKFDYNC